MIELVNRYEAIKEEHEKELLFVDTILKEQNYQSQIRRINNNKALPILDEIIGHEHYFILVKPKLKKQFFEDQLLNMDVVNLIFSIEEFINEEYLFSKHCKRSIKDIRTKNMCSDLIDLMQSDDGQKSLIKEWRSQGATIEETEIDGFYTVNFNKSKEV